MEAALAESLIHASNCGQRSDNSWKKSAWEQAKIRVQAVPGPSIVTIPGLKHKVDAWKKDWKIWDHLTSQSGFGVNEDGCVVADEDALNAYFAAHPEALKFRAKPLKMAEELRQLFGGLLATGSYATSAEDTVSLSIEDSPTPSQSVSRGASEVSLATPSSNKRSASNSATGPRKRAAPADRVGCDLAGLTTQIASLIAVMEKDYQRDAIQIFEEKYGVLPSSLKLAVMRAFEKDYFAKQFCVMRPASRRKWVQKLLLDSKDSIISDRFDSEQFDSAVDSVEWDDDGDGDLVLKIGAKRVDSRSTS